jgi:hypothetical protein
MIGVSEQSKPHEVLNIMAKVRHTAHRVSAPKSALSSPTHPPPPLLQGMTSVVMRLCRETGEAFVQYVLQPQFLREINAPGTALPPWELRLSADLCACAVVRVRVRWCVCVCAVVRVTCRIGGPASGGAPGLRRGRPAIPGQRQAHRIPSVRHYTSVGALANRAIVFC